MMSAFSDLRTNTPTYPVLWSCFIHQIHARTMSRALRRLGGATLLEHAVYTPVIMAAEQGVRLSRSDKSETDMLNTSKV
jgi:hypothetical protein